MITEKEFIDICDRLKITYTNFIDFHKSTGQTTDLEPLISLVGLLEKKLKEKDREFKELDKAIQTL